MNGPIVSVMPTLCAPEKLSKPELVEQVSYLQEQVLKQSQTLHEVSCKLAEMCVCSNRLASYLYALVDAFDEDDTEAIAVQLQGLSERRKSYKKPEVH